MKRFDTGRSTGLIIVAGWLVASGVVLGTGCRAGSQPASRPKGQPAQAAQLGVPRGSSALMEVLAEPGPVELETVAAADWAVPRSGLINLDHAHARAAGLEDGDEPVQIYVYVLRHPEHGTFLVDTGVERALREMPERAASRALFADMNVDSMRIHVDTAALIAAQREPIAGVLLTHLHADHIAGLPDIPRGTPIYTGPGETLPEPFQHLFSRGTSDRAGDKHAPVREWKFEPDPDGLFDGVLDVFGDGSVWALHVPGHTPGSTAYLVRTPDGPVLLVGDASHTAWGWTHGVEPGTFSVDQPRSAVSLERLRRWVAAHPGVEVRPGHQPPVHQESRPPAARPEI